MTRGPPQARIICPRLPLRLDHLDELGQVLDVEVLLGDRLRDEDRVGAHLDRLREQHAVGDLAAEVVGLEAPVALEAVVAVVALQVQHRVDPHAVGVRAGAGAHDHDPAPEVLAAKRSISSSLMYSMSKPSSCRAVKSTSRLLRPYITKYV